MAGGRTVRKAAAGLAAVLGALKGVVKPEPKAAAAAKGKTPANAKSPAKAKAATGNKVARRGRSCRRDMGGSRMAKANNTSLASHTRTHRPRTQHTRTPNWPKVRVWWPPTTDKSRTGFSGAYWPATELKKSADSFKVQYDNGDVETVHVDNIFPFGAPIDFGKEVTALQVRCGCGGAMGCDVLV